MILHDFHIVIRDELSENEMTYLAPWDSGEVWQQTTRSSLILDPIFLCQDILNNY